MRTETRIARALLEIEAVVFTPQNPITFKSGIKSPVYVDNRRLPFWPSQWQTIIEGFAQMIRDQAIHFDIIAGIETAGIPHSAALAYVLKKPSVFVRKQPKEHGTRSRIEGGNVQERRVLLIEDLVTTGGSSLAGVEALRDNGAVVEDCLCIISYGFAEAEQAFDAANVHLRCLAPFTAIVQEAEEMGRFGPGELDVVRAWMDDPYGWFETTSE